MQTSSDSDIIEGLRNIDESEDIIVNDWEANFLDSIKKMTKPRTLSPKQRAAAISMIEKYLLED